MVIVLLGVYSEYYHGATSYGFCSYGLRVLGWFLSDIPDVPMGKDVDLAIELELRTKHISIPHCRMFPQELKELKDWL